MHWILFTCLYRGERSTTQLYNLILTWNQEQPKKCEKVEADLQLLKFAIS